MGVYRFVNRLWKVNLLRLIGMLIEKYILSFFAFNAYFGYNMNRKSYHFMYDISGVFH